MRRSRQQLSEMESLRILASATSGVLALSGDDGYPYAVPLSYHYAEGLLYFHCAQSGHKLDALAKSPKASFCVIAQDDVVPEKYTTCYRSVIAFGTVRILAGEAEKRQALSLLAAKYTPDDPEGCAEEVAKTLPHVCMLEMKIEHLTGKQGAELL